MRRPLALLGAMGVTMTLIAAVTAPAASSAPDPGGMTMANAVKAKG